MQIKKAIVPAAGLGTRLLPATKSQPKEMLPVGRKPILQHVIEELQAAELHQILIITGRRKRAIEDHFDADPDLIAILKKTGKEREAAGLSYTENRTRFFYTRQSIQKGLGDAVALGAEFADDDDFAVALGDSLIYAADPAALLRNMMAAHVDLKAAAIVAVEQVPADQTHRYGIVSLSGTDPLRGKDPNPPAGEPAKMLDIIEKPEPGRSPSRLAVAARYVMSPAIFEALGRTMADRRGEIQLTDAIRLLIKKGLPVYAWPLPPDEQRYDIGNFESYFKSFIDYTLNDEQYGEIMKRYLMEKAHELSRSQNR